ncbi:MAG: hypothetical protein FWH16_03225 [Oscillospiraceae bacterium]|nr:hypothetical protein [Oscillospiraceae bacterium]
MLTKWEFDERQLYIRGQVFFHGFISALLLLLFNAFLHSMGVVWASGFHQNITIMALTSTIASTEAILRGAYFGKGKSRWTVIAVFGSLSLMLWILNIQHILQGSAVLENGSLTQDGFSLILAALFSLTALLGLLKELMERRKRGE